MPVRSSVAASETPRRVLIVDDSAVTRAILARLVDAGDDWMVARAVSTVEAALAFLAGDRVEAIVLDINLPGTDGLTALPGLVVAAPGATIVVVSSLEGPARRALALGAAAVLAKPGPGDSTSRFGAVLLDALDRPAAAAAPPPPRPTPATVAAVGRSASLVPAARGAFDIVAIGASTGGIHALGGVLRGLPADCRLPILVTQHLPASFMPYFAAQLASLAGRPCEVATDRMRVRPGRVVVAPGDAHLHCVDIGDGNSAIRLSTVPAASGCMPSVDPMLTSLAPLYGERLLAIVLSGMGRDGLDGARAVHAAGGSIVAQDCESSVVWGMPGAVVAAGIADAILPPDRIGALIVSGGRPQ